MTRRHSFGGVRKSTLALVVGLALCGVVSGQGITWHTDFNQAFQDSRERQLPLLINFSGSDWCAWCKRLEEEVFSRPEYAAYANGKFVHCVLDTTSAMLQSGNIRHRYLIDRFQVSGYPTIVIVDERQQAIGRGGYVKGGVPAFIKFLEPYAPKKTQTQAVAQAGQNGLDRGADAILRNVTRILPDHTSKEPQEAFAVAVLLSHWEDARQHLAAVPDGQAAGLYASLLTMLQSKAKAGSTAPLSPEDVVHIADLCPDKEFKDATVTALGAVWREALTSDKMVERIVVSLEFGVGRIGGTDVPGRRLAAKLLFAAGQARSAVLFLDSPRESIGSKDKESMRYHVRALTDRAVAENDGEALDLAWQIALVMLEPEGEETFSAEGLDAVTELLPYLPTETADPWLGNTFRSQPSLAAELVGRIGTIVMAGAKGGAVDARLKQLRAMHRLDSFLTAWPEGYRDVCRDARAALAWAWLAEADCSVGNMKVKRVTEFQAKIGRRSSRPKPVKPFVQIEDVIELGPTDIEDAGWTPGLPVKVSTARIRLAIQAEDIDGALQEITLLAKDEPAQAKELAGELVDDWTEFHALFDPSMSANNRTPVRTGRRPVLLTAARHRKALADLTTMAQRLKGIPGLQVDEHKWINAFVKCYPRLEVFSREDIEGVFGPVKELNFELAAALAQTMRMNLTNTWRDPKLRWEAGESADNEAIREDVNRGYTLLREILETHMREDPKLWTIRSVLGSVLYDWAEYEHNLGVSLETYVERREAALDWVEKGCEEYGKHALTLTKSSYSIAPYWLWFQVVLGASDLSHVSGEGALPEERLADLRKAILALPEDVADAHMDLFVRYISTNLSRIPAHAKPRVLRAALAVTGECSGMAAARELLEFYDELVGEYGEIKLLAELHGPPEIGHDSAFAVTLKLRHTEALGMTSGGFSRYVAPPSVTSRTQPGADSRAQFEENIREALGDTFEVVSVVFPDPSAKPEPAGVDGWEDTPLACVVLRANDAAIDVIPAIQLDMDFQDAAGAVVLPVLSPVVPVSAREKASDARPCGELEIRQTIDTRRWDRTQTLTLEVSAKGVGVLPELDALVDLNDGSLKVRESDDEGRTVREVRWEGGLLKPVMEQAWVFEVEPASGARETRFKFPPVIVSDADVSYQQYDDVDLVDVDSSVLLAGLRLGRRPVWPWVVLVAIVAGAAFGWWRFRSREHAGEEAVAHHYAVPEDVNPFTVIGLLRRIQGDTALAGIAEKNDELSADIRRVEEAYFGRASERPIEETELAGMARNWVDATRRRRA